METWEEEEVEELEGKVVLSGSTTQPVFLTRVAMTSLMSAHARRL